MGNKVSSPSWVWHVIVHLGMCFCVDTCKFKGQGSGGMFYVSGHVSYVFIHIHSPSGLRILEESYKKCCLYGPPPPPHSPLRGGAGGGGDFREIVQWDLLGCENHLFGWCFCRAL